MNKLKVIKRDGTEVDFDIERIVTAIKKAGGSKDIAIEIAKEIELETDHITSIKEIEHKVVDKLITNGFREIALSYESYRAIQEYNRNMEIRSETTRILDEGKKENANKYYHPLSIPDLNIHYVAVPDRQTEYEMDMHTLINL